MANWFEIYPEENGAELEFSDYPTKREIFEKLQNTGILSLDADISSYEVDSDCSFINVYNTNIGDLVYKFEIK